jgi:hypothetical protein
MAAEGRRGRENKKAGRCAVRRKKKGEPLRPVEFRLEAIMEPEQRSWGTLSAKTRDT